MKTFLGLIVFVYLNQVVQAQTTIAPAFWEYLENGDSRTIIGSATIVNVLRDLEKNCRDGDGKSFFENSFLISQAMISNPIIEVFAYRQGRLLVVRPMVLDPGERNSGKVGWDFYCELF